MRVGISAGDITWADGDCHGTPVVTASRLCNSADGGQILCDDLVRGLARGRTDLTFRMIGELTLKGLSEPVMSLRGRVGRHAAATTLLRSRRVALDPGRAAFRRARRRAPPSHRRVEAGADGRHDRRAHQR